MNDGKTMAKGKKRSSFESVKNRSFYRSRNTPVTFRVRKFRVRWGEVCATVTVSALAASMAAVLFLASTDHAEVTIRSDDCEQAISEWGQSVDTARTVRAAGGDAKAADTLATIAHSRYILSCFATDDGLTDSLLQRMNTAE